MSTRAISPRVFVVGDNPETVDGLQAYFVGVGIDAQSTNRLDAAMKIPERATAVVLFPDGFSTADVVDRMAALRHDRPGLLLLVVTAQPQRFADALRAEAHPSSCLVLAKPAFGWTIVDAIRLHAEASAP